MWSSIWLSWSVFTGYFKCINIYIKIGKFLAIVFQIHTHSHTHAFWGSILPFILSGIPITCMLDTLILSIGVPQAHFSLCSPCLKFLLIYLQIHLLLPLSSLICCQVSTGNILFQILYLPFLEFLFGLLKSFLFIQHFLSFDSSQAFFKIYICETGYNTCFTILSC